jgi:predicted DNA-binding transcriptional regulator YafY
MFLAKSFQMIRQESKRASNKPSSKGKKKRSRPLSIPEKVLRLLEIYTLIAQGRYPSVTLLMSRLAISKRSVFRYLEVIGMIHPVIFNVDRKGYAFVEGSRIGKLRLSHEELLVILAAGEAVSHLGKPFEECFRRLIESLDLEGAAESR